MNLFRLFGFADGWRCAGAVVTLGALAFGVLAAGTAQAVILDAADDTWVREDNSESNRDGEDFMNARTDSDADDNDVVLVRYDLSTLASPATGASLNFTWYRTDGSTSNTLSLWGINDSTADDVDWDEAAIVYDDAPGMIADGMDPTAESGAGHSDDDIHDLDSANLTKLIADQAYPAAGQVEGEIYSFSSAALDAFINADTNDTITFLVTRSTSTSANQARFVSNTATSTSSGVLTGPAGFAGPKLNTVPEPTTILLLGMAVAPFALARRRS